MIDLTSIWIDECDSLFPELTANRNQVDPVDILKEFLAAEQMDRLCSHIMQGRCQRHDKPVVTTTTLPRHMEEVVDHDWTLPRHTARQLRHALDVELLDGCSGLSLGFALYGAFPLHAIGFRLERRPAH